MSDIEDLVAAVDYIGSDEGPIVMALLTIGDHLGEDGEGPKAIRELAAEVAETRRTVATGFSNLTRAVNGLTAALRNPKATSDLTIEAADAEPAPITWPSGPRAEPWPHVDEREAIQQEPGE